MSRLFPENFRYFFKNYIRNGAFTAITYGFIPVSQASVGRAVGKIRFFHHGQIVIFVADADKAAAAQAVGQFPGGNALGGTGGI